MVYAVGIVLLGMVFLICQWIQNALKWLWGRLKRGSARIKRWLLIPVWYWYGVQDQSGEKRRTVIVDGRVTELELFDCGKLLAEEKIDENGESIGSNKTLVEGASLWTRLCRFAASPPHLLRKTRPRQMTEDDIEKNDISPASYSESETKVLPGKLEAPPEKMYCRSRDMAHLKAQLSAFKPHRPRILHAVRKGQRTRHPPTKIGQEIVPTVVSPSATGSFAKKEHFLSLDCLEKINNKEVSIGSDRTLAERPSIWRRIRNLFSSSGSSQPAADSLPVFQDVRKDCKKGMPSSSSSSTMVGSEDGHISEKDPVTAPKSVYTGLTNCGRV